MKTILVLEIDHKKPIPTKTPITDVAAQRLYTYLYSQGVEASVNAIVSGEHTDPQDRRWMEPR